MKQLRHSFLDVCHKLKHFSLHEAAFTHIYVSADLSGVYYSINIIVEFQTCVQTERLFLETNT